MYEEFKKLLDGIKESRDFSPFVGMVEDDYFEAKESRGYDLDNFNNQVELTKDVSAFANASGGLLVIGLVTDREQTSKIDRVAKLDLFDSGVYNIGKLTGILRSGIHPALENLQVEYICSKEDDSKGIIYILVPPQDEKIKPFLMKNLPETEDGERTRQIIFGFAQRTDSNNNPTPITDIYKWIKSGKSDQTQSLLRIEEKLNSLFSHKETEKEIQFSPVIHLTEKINQAIADQFSSTPVLVLSCSPLQPIFIKEFFVTKDPSAYSLIRNPQKTRHAGWDVTTLDNPKIIKGECWSVSNGERKLLRVYEDGSVVFAGAADGSFLGWGKNAAEFERKPRLNPVALIELTYNFVVFVKDLQGFIDKPSKELHFQLSLANLWLEETKIYLLPGNIKSMEYQFDLDDKEPQKQKKKFQ
ncbi:MAG: ATP-binding protein [Candidatus Riflebacteria bacterium]